MDQAWEIVGIVIAILMVIIGLRLLLNKPQPLPKVSPDNLAIEETSQQPVIPRHARETLLASPLSKVSDVEKQASTTNTSSTPIEQPLSPSEKTVQTNVGHADTADKTDLDEIQAALAQEPELVKEVLQADLQEDVKTTQPAHKNSEDNALSVKESADQDDNFQQQSSDQTNTQTKQSDELSQAKETMQPLQLSDDDWENESTVFDAHLSAQDRSDEESTLATAQKIVAFYLYPNPERALSGERTLKMLLKYGLRYGEMACFHRYEHADQVSPLMFSVLRINEDGAPTGFDLEALPTEEVKGLAFFLALPNPNALQGFDMMASTAILMARDSEGRIFDESGFELTQQSRDHIRHEVIEYNPNQPVE